MALIGSDLRGLMQSEMKHVGRSQTAHANLLCGVSCLDCEGGTYCQHKLETWNEQLRYGLSSARWLWLNNLATERVSTKSDIFLLLNSKIILLIRDALRLKQFKPPPPMHTRCARYPLYLHDRSGLTFHHIAHALPAGPTSCSACSAGTYWSGTGDNSNFFRNQSQLDENLIAL